MHRSLTPIILISLLSAGILTFCAPPPVAAQSAATATGAYIDCKKVAQDVSLAVQAIKVGADFGKITDDWYSKVVISHAVRAIKSDNPAQYVRDLHKACLLETA